MLHTAILVEIFNALKVRRSKTSVKCVDMGRVIGAYS